MDQVIENKFDAVIELLGKISTALTDAKSDKKTPKTGYRTGEALKKDDGSGDVNTAENGPREILDKKNVVDDYGPDLRKFWTDLFEKYFSAGDSKKEEDPKKPTSFWKKILGLLPLIAAAALGALNKILEWFKKLDLLNDLKKWWKEFNLIGKIIDFFKESKLLKWVKTFFRNVKAGIIRQLRKTKLGRAVLKAFRFVSRIVRNVFKGILKVFKGIKTSKIGNAIGKVMRIVGRVFKGLFNGVKVGVKFGSKIFGAILKAVKGVFKAIGTVGKFFPTLLKAFKFGGKLLGKLFIPLTILFSILDIVDGIFTTIKKEGLSFESVIKGLGVGIVKILTLGFIDTDIILETFNNMSDQIADWINTVMDIPGKLTGWFKDKVKGFKKFLGMEESSSDIADDLKKLSDSGKGSSDEYKKKMADYKAARERESDTSQPKSNIPTKSYMMPQRNDFISRPNEPSIPFNSKDTIVGFKEDGPLALLSKQAIDIQKEHLEASKAMIDILKRAATELTNLNSSLAKTVTPSQNIVVSSPKISNYTGSSSSNQTALRLRAVN